VFSKSSVKANMLRELNVKAGAYTIPISHEFLLVHESWAGWMTLEQGFDIYIAPETCSEASRRLK
jgi:hypothetical protein